MIKNFKNYNKVSQRTKKSNNLDNCKVGDWVLLKGQGWNVLMVCKILQIKDNIDLNKKKFEVKTLRDRKKLSSNYAFSFVEFWLDYDEIERLATEDEILETEIFWMEFEYNL